MGNLCSSPSPATPGQSIALDRDEVTKLVLLRLASENPEKDATPSEFTVTAEESSEGLGKILDELFNKESWEYTNCTKEDFKGVFTLMVECADGSTLSLFVGEEATSVLPEFDMNAKKHKAFKSKSKKDLGLKCPLYGYLEELAVVKDDNEASTSDVPEDPIDEFDEPVEVEVQAQTKSSSI